jgi:hypothetical protein
VAVAVAVTVTVGTTVIVSSMPVAKNVKVDVTAKVADVVVVAWMKEEQKATASADTDGDNGISRSSSIILHYPYLSSCRG